MPERLRFFTTDVVLKTLMAITGLIMAVFVVFHLYNNIHIYFGQEIYNRYGFAWKTPVVISTARPTLLVSVIIHLLVGIHLKAKGTRSRAGKYIILSYRKTGWISRTMIVTGLLTGAYIAFHVLHAKIGTVFPTWHLRLDSRGLKDVYNLIVESFQVPWVSGAYLLGLGALGLHLSRGIASAFMTLGITQDPTSRKVALFSRAIALLVFLGYGSIPFCVILGILQPAS